MLKKFNELNSTTYLSAANKAKKYGQVNRTKSLIDYVFYDFIGKEINDTIIKNIVYGGNNKKTLYVQLEQGSPLIYLIDEDELEKTSSVTNRKSAVLLSKIILKTNPDSKYKNVNNIEIDNY